LTSINFKHACALGCEGIVSKRLGRSGRVDHWLKIENPVAPAVRGLRTAGTGDAKLTLTDSVRRTMTNLLAQAINSDDPDHAAKLIRDALGIESEDVVNYCFPKQWPADRERRARYIGEWLKTEARYLA
jgi:hypothetical protein